MSVRDDYFPGCVAAAPAAPRPPLAVPTTSGPTLAEVVARLVFQELIAREEAA